MLGSESVTGCARWSRRMRIPRAPVVERLIASRGSVRRASQRGMQTLPDRGSLAHGAQRAVLREQVVAVGRDICRLGSVAFGSYA